MNDHLLITVRTIRLRNKAGFLLLTGVIPRRSLRVLPPSKKKPPRNFDIYLEIVLEELRQLYVEGISVKPFPKLLF